MEVICWEVVGEVEWLQYMKFILYFHELVQERCNSIANAMELCLSYTNPSISQHKFREIYFVINVYLMFQIA